MNLQQNFQREQCLQGAECPRDRAQYTRFRTVTHHAVGNCIRPKATQAGVLRFRLVDLQLPLVLIHAGENGGLAREHRGIVDKILRAEIITAVHDDVMAAD
jgi:hypothetical protein